MAKRNKDLAEVVEILNEKFESESWVEIVKPNLALFPLGQIWTCDECDAIHVGFHLNTMPEMIGKMSLALARYEDRLRIESVPIYVDDDNNVFEGEEAFIEFGKMLVSAFACSDCFSEIIKEGQMTKPSKGMIQ